MSRKRRRPQQQEAHPPQAHPPQEIANCTIPVLYLQSIVGDIARLLIFEPDGAKEIYLELFAQAYCYLTYVALLIGISPDAISDAQNRAIKALVEADKEEQQQQQQEGQEEEETP